MRTGRRKVLMAIAVVVVVTALLAAIPLKIEYDIRPYLVTMSVARQQAAEIIQRGRLDDIADGLEESKALISSSLSHEHLDVQGRMLVVDEVWTDLKVIGPDGQAYSPLVAVDLRSEGRDGKPHTKDDVVALVTFIRHANAWHMERCVCVEQKGQRFDHSGNPLP